jgi:RND superfamily putative drug exporter
VATLERHGVGGEAGPLAVLLASPIDWNGKPGRECLAHVTDSLGRLPNVAAVRSPVTEGAPTRVMTAVLGPDNEVMPRRTAHVARLEVVFVQAPGSSEAVAALDTVQAWLRERLPSAAQGTGSVTWSCAGPTVAARDLGKVAGADGTRAAWLMLAALLAVLAVLVGRIETVVHLVLAVVVSFPAALGVAGLIGVFWGGTIGEVDWPTAALLFPILVAGGAGLSLIPVNRSQASAGRGQEPEEKLRRNLTWTSRRTAGCALLLAGFWAVLLLAGRGVTARLGLAASAGLLIDALVVRRVLVPALAVYLWCQRRELQGGWRKLQEPDLVRRAG